MSCGLLFAQQPNVDLKPSKIILYKYCQNHVRFNFGALEDTIKPHYQFLGGELRLDPKYNFIGGKLELHPKTNFIVALFPKEDSAKVMVSYKKDSIIVPLDTITFKVLDIPLPKVSFKMDSKNSKLTVFAEADSMFAKELRYDARYQIAEVALKVIYPPKMKQEPVEYTDKRQSEIRRFTSLMIDLSEFDLRKGYSIEVEVKKINRINYQDKVIDITSYIPDYRRNFIINFK